MFAHEQIRTGNWVTCLHLHTMIKCEFKKNITVKSHSIHEVWENKRGGIWIGARINPFI